MREIFIGIALAVATALGLAWLQTELARGAGSIPLTLIAAIYLGFALASHGRLSVKKQGCACTIFVRLALLGLGYSGWFSVAGLVLHGGWDLSHHRERGVGVIPDGYPPFCAVYDWGIALFAALALSLARLGLHEGGKGPRHGAHPACRSKWHRAFGSLVTGLGPVLSIFVANPPIPVAEGSR